jgi:hypothetical protein
LRSVAQRKGGQVTWQDHGSASSDIGGAHVTGGVGSRV